VEVLVKAWGFRLARYLWPLPIITLLKPFFGFLQYLGEIDKWGIDIFRIAELSNNRPLTAVAYAAFTVSIIFI
jgi:hypothetical protein